ncbi:DEKNAAC103836 [Brettanomyces naardenensis]|uniref:DEKNAAC103836 n=1 Tax=Brettanomyces naardenensis TaxID=13370 RepID=A0A448YPI0_BRENA|nr:DEKNAAC103836 [Brettanomyces naardenensis]
MVALSRKHRVSSISSKAVSAKRARRSHSLEWLRASRMKSINSIPPPKDVPNDFFVWGSGAMCELGLGPAAKTKEVKRPRLNPFLPKDTVGVVDFAAGGMHTLVLDKTNRVWSWGNNDMGVLGRDTSHAKEVLRDADGTDEDEDEDADLNEAESTPGLVDGLPKERIVQLVATDNLSAVLLETGSVYAWGTFRCNEGILGFSRSVKVQRSPVRIENFDNIVQLAAGKDHLLALDTKGIAYAWGNGQQFQLGRKIMDRTRLTSLEPRSFGLKNVKFVGSGDYHSFAITHDGKVLSWGLNQFGQCGISTDVDDGSIITRPTEVTGLSGKGIVAITGGEHHSLALSSSGEVYVFGRYDMKEIGIEKDKLPLDDCVKDAHGNVRCLPVPTKLTTLPSIKAVEAGPHHSLALSRDGVVFAWGFADTYAVGLGNLDEDVDHPTRIDNTATRDHAIELIGCGGQFSVSAGNKRD